MLYLQITFLWLMKKIFLLFIKFGERKVPPIKKKCLQWEQVYCISGTFKNWNEKNITSFWHHYGVTEKSLKTLEIYFSRKTKLQLADQNLLRWLIYFSKTFSSFIFHGPNNSHLFFPRKKNFAEFFYFFPLLTMSLVLSGKLYFPKHQKRKDLITDLECL